MPNRVVVIGRAVANTGLLTSAYDVLDVAASVDAALPNDTLPGFTLPWRPDEAQALAEAIAPVIDYIRHGQKIQAIKAWRTVTNSGLKEAKDAVDAMARVVPADLTTPPATPWHGVWEDADPPF